MSTANNFDFKFAVILLLNNSYTIAVLCLNTSHLNFFFTVHFLKLFSESLFYIKIWGLGMLNFYIETKCSGVWFNLPNYYKNT